jgi:hypothetical protein
VYLCLRAHSSSSTSPIRSDISSSTSPFRLSPTRLTGEISSPQGLSQVPSALLPAQAPSLTLVGQTTSVSPDIAKEAQKQMAVLKERLAIMVSENQDPLNQLAFKGQSRARFSSADETPVTALNHQQQPYACSHGDARAGDLAPEVPDQAQLFVSQGLIGIEGDRPEELDDLLDVNEPQDLRDRTRQTETAGVGWEFLEEEEEQEGYKGRVSPAKKDLSQSGTLQQTFAPMPDPATLQCLKLGFEYGIVAPAKHLAGSYRQLTAASNIQQWGFVDDEQNDGVRQWSPAAPNCGGEVKEVEGGPAAHTATLVHTDESILI